MTKKELVAMLTELSGKERSELHEKHARIWYHIEYLYDSNNKLSYQLDELRLAVVQSFIREYTYRGKEGDNYEN